MEAMAARAAAGLHADHTADRVVADRVVAVHRAAAGAIAAAADIRTGRTQQYRLLRAQPSPPVSTSE